MTKTKGLLSLKVNKKQDCYTTPRWPIEALWEQVKQTVPGSAKMFDPCSGEDSGPFTAFFTDKGYQAEGKDILQGYNFLEDPIPEGTTHIITNPPFSLKDQFLAKCYESGLPFALIMPLTALEGVKRQKMYKEYGVEVFILPRRPNFRIDGKGCWFPCGWFTHGFNLGIPLKFIEEVESNDTED